MYFGLGADVSTILFTKFGRPLDLHGGRRRPFRLLALALGYPCFRLRGHYFTIATVVIAETGYLLFLNRDWAGAALGIQIPVRRDSWLLFQFPRDKIPYFLFRARSCVCDLVGNLDLRGFQMGLLVAGCEGQPEAAESLGVVVFHSKMAAAAVSALFTSIAGSFYAQFVGTSTPRA